MRKYTVAALLIISVGIITSIVFLLFFPKKQYPENNISSGKNEQLIIDKTELDHPEKPQEDLLGDIYLQNDSGGDESKNSDLGDKNVEEEIPSFVENIAPFISQAPFGVWDELHDEACEEAAIIIANGFLNESQEISKEKADEEILKLVDWQMKKYGKHKDLNIEEIQDMAFEFYGNEFEISENVNEESFKKILAGGNIIIIPAAGRELGNPFFTPPGPLYHALVVIGYDDSTKEFITNDPGTRRGEGFRYSYKTLLESIHDFPGKKEKILEGDPRVLIVAKQ